MKSLALRYLSLRNHNPPTHLIFAHHPPRLFPLRILPISLIQFLGRPAPFFLGPNIVPCIIQLEMPQVFGSRHSHDFDILFWPTQELCFKFLELAGRWGKRAWRWRDMDSDVYQGVVRELKRRILRRSYPSHRWSRHCREGDSVLLWKFHSSSGWRVWFRQECCNQREEVIRCFIQLQRTTRG